MNFITFLLQKIKTLVDYSGLLSKFIIGFGIFLIIIYFLYIGYFPTDLSLGDGLLFFLITVKFAFVYLLFLGSHYALGNVLFRTISVIKNICITLFSFREKIAKTLLNIFFTKLSFKDIIEKIGLIFIQSLLSIFGLAFVFVFYGRKSLNLIIMIFLSLLLKFCIDKFLNQLKKEKLNNKKLTESEKEQGNKKILIMLLYILLVPSVVYLFYIGKEKNFFIANTLGSVREDDKNSIIYIKLVFKDFFPEAKNGEKRGEYIEIKDAEVLLRGVGKNALVQYTTRTQDQNGNIVPIKVKVEIPNDSLLIIRRSPDKK
ncbi:hypothetical protein [Acinetobacter baumannii]|uniref:hypothetical protein n=3 Tax=Acinetobacter baumannii TaxID=470 RepID=UPI00062C3B01|nr:hypothetical protein [Acinetobacter baumannii]KKZ37743.1 hypothetical protein UN98_17305 [Acinetobacter baumannii]TPT46459.1 hypothetical protein FJU63_15790 [Acinetobacter baumannii]HDU8433428.1 hypothetical protein [Acinetobacter baumannii]